MAHGRKEMETNGLRTCHALIRQRTFPGLAFPAG